MECTKCPISSNCNSAQLGQGKKSAKILFVSDHPTWEENDHNEWMGTRAGKLFKDLLVDVDIPLEDCFFTGAIKCVTQQDDKGNYVQPSGVEIKNCSPYLEMEIKLVNPDIIVPLGNVALKQVLGVTGITQNRGKAVEKDGRIIFPILHPDMVFRQPKHSENFTTDIKNLGLIYQTGMDFLKSADVDYRYLETIEEVRAEIERLKTVPWLVFDLETTGLNPYGAESKIVCISLTDRTHYGVTIPTRHKDFEWSVSELEEVEQLIKELLETKGVNKMGHNGKFDMKWVLAKHGIDVADYKFDPMLAHYIAISEERGGHGLKALAWEHTDMGGYDNKLDDFKQTLPESIRHNYDNVPWEILREYAAADVDCTMRLFKKFSPLIEAHSKWPSLFDMYLEGSYALRDLEHNGAKIDLERAKRFKEAYRKEIDGIEVKLRSYPEIVMIEREKLQMYETRQLEMKKPKEERDPEVVKWNKYKNFKFSFGSTAQLRELLFDKLGLDTPFLTKKGQLKRKDELTIQDYSTGKETLAYLADRHPIVKLMSEWRKLEKLYGTYINPAAEEWVQPDGLVHGSFNLTGCVTGDTLIKTSKGELRIDSLFDYEDPEKFYELKDQELEIYDGEEYRKPIAGFYKGFTKVVTVETAKGFKITCTLNHRLGTPTGWTFGADFKVGDVILTDDEALGLSPDAVTAVSFSEEKTFDLAMDPFDQEEFNEMRFIFNSGMRF